MNIKLKKQKDFDLVFNKGNRVYSKSLTLLFIKNDSVKIGISVSKKHGKAFLRNRIKRIIRACMINFTSKFNDNYYVVIVPKVLNEYSYQVFLQDLEYTLKKGKLING